MRLALGPILSVVFDAIDVDKSGHMELKEFETCVNMLLKSEKSVKDIMEFMVRLVDVNRDGKLQRSEVMNLAQQMAKISSITAHAVLDSSMEAWLEIVKANVPGEIVTKEQIAQMKAEVPEEVNFSGEL